MAGGDENLQPSQTSRTMGRAFAAQPGLKPAWQKHVAHTP
jgi:hypothetical protein